MFRLSNAFGLAPDTHDRAPEVGVMSLLGRAGLGTCEVACGAGATTCAGASNGLVVVDVSDPATPPPLGQLLLGEIVHDRDRLLSGPQPPFGARVQEQWRSRPFVGDGRWSLRGIRGRGMDVAYRLPKDGP